MPTSPWSRADRKRRIGATALVSAASTAALIGLPATASAGQATEQTLNDTPSRVDPGTQVTFAGTLTGANDQPISGQEVDLERKLSGTWSVVGGDTTDGEGKVSIPYEVNRTAEWRLVYRGDRFHEQDGSETTQVQAEEEKGEQIVDEAASHDGKPYSYGADGPDSFDCSGLTQYVHKQVGIELPRTSQEQRDSLDTVDPADKQPGDLIFFDDGGEVYHVGIYAGDNSIWHAPEEGSDVHRKELWTDDYTVGRAW